MANLNLEILISSLTELASRNNLSINKMLTACGVSKSVVDNLKRGKYPNIDIIYTIADYFDVSIDYLFGREKVVTSELSALSENELELLKPFRQLSDHNQAKAIGRVEDVLINQQETDQTKENVG